MLFAILFVYWGFLPGGSFEHLRVGEHDSQVEKVVMLVFKEAIDLLETRS